MLSWIPEAILVRHSQQWFSCHAVTFLEINN